ncbi:sulfotransferase family 2 domain-containing protein [Lutimonas zeaxanthinifaciens]|uniref:sulfotransferase family 2 domain-containing protein n=1 Tax=Lutimonas zeaxanthinifaciens TaxID=3060215 RepID=UPI00265CCB40|nr:sulfotransferase family 2 domain-containing protein [Lutimonas sp. YSD2104]WKK67361.1 sulfotransferase family 2 domain-containing protein [Lutimonas sp. YSD2104]
MLAFCHIPKTAGSTFNYILQKNFGCNLNSIIPRNGSNYYYKDLKKDQFVYGGAKCIAGHGLKPFIDYKEFNSKLKWITFFRDPIKRFVSQYIHQQTSNLSQYHMPIIDWAEKYERRNWQVKWIAGEEDLIAAKQIIEEKFIFSGVTEKFDQSLILFRSLLDNKIDISYTTPKMVVRNYNLKNELLNEKYDSLLTFFIEQNELDIQLYDFAKRNFEKAFNQISLKERSYFEQRSFCREKMFGLKRELLYKPYVYLTK